MEISRSQYWLKFFLPVFVVSLVLAAITVTSGGSSRRLLHIFQLIVLWPGLAILIKRIHDRDKSGALVWFFYRPMMLAVIIAVAAAIAGGGETDSPAASPLWIITALPGIVIAGIGIWFFIEFGCLRGTIGANRYGPDPVNDR